ncbi:MAG: substrate-binding domain-containing protein [Phycisphaerae bacterium]|jgi:ribose transport system substrate-binding protein|nr:substrate-binding domain-containing protein [Phycisphaerae bacterium]
MKTLQTVILLLVAVLAVGTGISCNRNNSASTGKTVAYSSPGDANGWFLAFSSELKKEAAKRGYGFSVTHAQQNTARQLSDVEDIVAQKPSFLILGPKDTKASADALRIAKEAGVPVVVVNRDINGKHGADYITKIYSDFEWIGEKMAQAVGEAFPAEKEKIRIVEIHGTLGSANTIGMSKGIRKVTDNDARMELVRSQPGNFQRDVAMEAMENIIQSGVEFDAIICHYDDEAMGVIQALTRKGRKMGNDPSKGEIIIVGNGGTTIGLEAVKAGKYHKIVSVTPYYADKVFEAIEAHLAGKTLEPYIRVDDIVIDKNNVDKHMATGF